MPWPTFPTFDDPFGFASPAFRGFNSTQREQPFAPPFTQPEEESMLGAVGRKVLGGVGWLAEALDKPGRAVRGLLGGRPDELLNLVPFSDTIGLTNPAEGTSGRDLAEQWGWLDANQQGLDRGDLLGFGLEVGLDPLLLLSGPGKALTTAGKAAAKSGVFKGAAGATMAGGRPLALGHLPGAQYASRLGTLGPEEAVAGLKVPLSSLSTAERIERGLGGLAKWGPFEPVGTGERSHAFGEAAGGAVDWLKARPWTGIPAIRAALSTKAGGYLDPTLQKVYETKTIPELEAVAPGVRQSMLPLREAAKEAGLVGEKEALIRSAAEHGGLPFEQLIEPDLQDPLRYLAGGKPSTQAIALTPETEQAAIQAAERVLPGARRGARGKQIGVSLGAPAEFAETVAPSAASKIPIDVSRGNRLAATQFQVGDVLTRPMPTGPDWHMGRVTAVDRNLGQVTVEGFEQPFAPKSLARDYGVQIERQAVLPESMRAESFLGAEPTFTAQTGGFGQPLTEIPEQFIRPDAAAAESIAKQAVSMKDTAWHELRRMGLKTPDLPQIEGGPMHFPRYKGGEAIQAGRWFSSMEHRIGAFTESGLDSAQIERLMNDVDLRGAANPALVASRYGIDNHNVARTLADIAAKEKLPAGQWKWGSALGDLQSYIENADKTAVAAKNIFHSLAPEHLGGVATDANSIIARGGKAVPLKDELFRQLGFDSPASARDYLSKTLNVSHQSLDNLAIDEKLIAPLRRRVQSFTNPDSLNPFISAYDKFLTLWKKSVLFPWPAYYMRNITSDAWRNWTDGAFSFGSYNDARQIVGGAQSLQGIARSIPALKGLSDQEATKALLDLGYVHGVGQATGATRELAEGVATGAPEAFSLGQSVLEAIPRSRAQLNPLGEQFAPFAAGGKIQAASENLGQWAHFVERLKQGYAPAEAAASMKGTMFEYGKLTPVERSVVKRIIPFWTFQRNVIPWMLERLVEQPGKIGVTVRGAGIGDEQTYKPQYLREQVAIPVPGAAEGNQRYIGGLGLPIEEFSHLQFGPHGIRRMVEKVMQETSPLIRVPAELFTGRQFMSGKTLGDLYPFPSDSPLLNELAYAAPFAARITPAIRAALDQRSADPTHKALKLGLNLGTGVKLTDVDTERVKRQESRRYVEDWLEDQPGIRQFRNFYVPKEDQGQITPEQRDMMRLENTLVEDAKVAMLKKRADQGDPQAAKELRGLQNRREKRERIGVKQ